MICTSKLIVAGVFLSALMVEPAFADSMRCGSHIISTGGLHGPGKHEVLKKCGEPTVRYGNTWIYERSGGANYAVVFDSSGYLVRID
jgi:hypothetical protein